MQKGTTTATAVKYCRERIRCLLAISICFGLMGCQGSGVKEKPTDQSNEPLLLSSGKPESHSSYLTGGSAPEPSSVSSEDGDSCAKAVAGRRPMLTPEGVANACDELFQKLNNPADAAFKNSIYQIGSSQKVSPIPAAAIVLYP